MVLFNYLCCTHIFLRIMSLEKGSSYLRRIPSNTINRTYKKETTQKCLPSHLGEVKIEINTNSYLPLVTDILTSLRKKIYCKLGVYLKACLDRPENTCIIFKLVHIIMYHQKVIIHQYFALIFTSV